MIIFEHILFWMKICSFLEKVQKKMFEKKKTSNFLERNLFNLFLFGKTDTRKKQTEKEEKRDNTTNAKKIKDN